MTGFHLFLPQMRMTPHDIVERARAAESAGFEGIAFMDHLTPPLAMDQDMWEAMSIAGWVLAHTDQLVVGHLVLCDAMRHPAVLARQITTLDHASGGRFELGIGWGSVPDELTAFGVGSAGSSARIERLGESLSVMRGLWAGGVVDHEGEHFSVVGAQQRPVPTHPIPITIGGTGPRTLELVRQFADWWNVPMNQLDQLARGRAEVGRARISLQQMVALVPSEDARGGVTASARRRFGAMAGRGLVVGSAAELAEHFGRLRAEGVERFYVWFTDFAPVETLRGFAQVIALTA